MIKIDINSQDDFEKFVKRFVKICKKDGFLQEIRDRRYYKKPSEIRRTKMRERERELSRKKNDQN